VRLFFFCSELDDFVNAYLFRYEFFRYCKARGFGLDQVVVEKSDRLDVELSPRPGIDGSCGKNIVLSSADGPLLGKLTNQAALNARGYDVALFFGLSGYLLKFIDTAGGRIRIIVFDAHFLRGLGPLFEVFGMDRVMGLLGRVEIVTPYGPSFLERYEALGFRKDMVTCILQPVSGEFFSPGRNKKEETGILVAPGETGRDFECLETACRGFPGDVIVAGGDAGLAFQANRETKTGRPDNMKYLGRLRYFEYRDLLERAQIVVLPLNDMNCGLVSLSMSMSLAKTIVATRTAFTEAYAASGGLKLVAEGDFVALREAILELMESPDKRAELEEKALYFAGRELRSRALFEKMFG